MMPVLREMWEDNSPPTGALPGNHISASNLNAKVATVQQWSEFGALMLHGGPTPHKQVCFDPRTPIEFDWENVSPATPESIADMATKLTVFRRANPVTPIGVFGYYPDCSDWGMNEDLLGTLRQSKSVGETVYGYFKRKFLLLEPVMRCVDFAVVTGCPNAAPYWPPKQPDGTYAHNAYGFGRNLLAASVTADIYRELFPRLSIVVHTNPYEGFDLVGNGYPIQPEGYAFLLRKLWQLIQPDEIWSWRGMGQGAKETTEKAIALLRK